MASGAKQKGTSVPYEASLYVDEDFETMHPLAGQESLSAFGLKLIDSRRTPADQQRSIISDSVIAASDLNDHEITANPEISHHKKRRKKNPQTITLADLNSVVNLDVLLGKDRDLDSVPQTSDERLNVQSESLKDSVAAPECDPDLDVLTSNPLEYRNATHALVEEKSEGVTKLVPQSASIKESSNVPVTRPPQNTENLHAFLKGSRLKKGFFNIQLPSRIPKRPRPEQFSKASKPPRPSALRQLQAINSKFDSNWPRDIEDILPQQKPESFNYPGPRLPLPEKEDTDFLSIKELNFSDLTLNKNYQHFDRNRDPDLPRNPDSAVHLLADLPTRKRLAFLHHIFYFFNHNHLTLLVKINNGQFITHLESWISDAINSGDNVLLRTLLLLLEILPVTPSSHCKALIKIFKTSKVVDSIISNLFSRVNEKWQFLEQTIRSHKAHKDKTSRPSISFCDETETLEYSIFLPPDTVRKTKRTAVKGTLKQVRKGAVPKDASSSENFKDTNGNKTVLPQDPRLEYSRRKVVSEVTPNSNDLSSCVLSSLRQSFDDASPIFKQSSVSFGGLGEGKTGSGNLAIGDIHSDTDRSTQLSSNSTVSTTESGVPDSFVPKDDPCSELTQASSFMSPVHKTITSGSSAYSYDGLADIGNIELSSPEQVTQEQYKSAFLSVGGSLLPVPFVIQLSESIEKEARNLNDVNLQSMNALLTLVPTLVKSFSSTLSSGQSLRLKSISPNPFLSSQKASQDCTNSRASLETMINL